MATKMKATDTAQLKLRRGPSPDQGKRTVRKPSPVGRQETLPSTLAEKPIPNYLKPTISSRPEPAKIVKKHGPESTPKPSLNRRKSYDRPPPATASAVQKVHSSGQRERSLIIKPSSPASKSAVSTRTMVDANSRSTTIAVTSRPTVPKTTKKGPTAPSNPTIQKESESSNSVGDAGDHEIDVVAPEVQVDDKAPAKVVPDHCEEVEDHIDVSITPPESKPTDHEDTGKSVGSECQEEIPHEVLQNILETVKEEESLPQEDIVPEEKINDAENHEQGDENLKEEAESITDVEVTEVEEKVEEPEKKEVSVEESVAKGDGESVTVEADPKGRDGKGETNDQGQDLEGVATSQVIEKPDEGANTTAIKSQKSMGKKDSAVSNDVIKETASKLLEKRRNKVRALVGAFETVISLQEPDQA